MRRLLCSGSLLADDTAREPKKSADGQVEMIRILRSVRQSAVKARTHRPQTNYCRLCWLAHQRTYATFSARAPYQESGRHLCPFAPWSCSY